MLYNRIDRISMVKKTDNYNILVYVPKNNIFITVLFVLIFFVLVLYFLPDYVEQLFSTFIGNFILILIVLGVGYFDYKYALVIACIFIIFFQAIHISKHVKKEGFVGASSSAKVASSSAKAASSSAKAASSSAKAASSSALAWSPELISQFLQYQNVHNPNYQFDMKVVQQQATPLDVQYLFQNNKWKWSREVQELYKDAISQNLLISVDPGLALNDAQSIYNEMAMKQLLSFQTKEGQFLLTGAVLGHTKNMPENVNNVAVCGMDNLGNSVLQKKLYTGYSGLDGHMIENITTIRNADIPSVVSGFRFLKNACNPCVALNGPPDYSCPFSINVGDGNDVSKIWRMLWGVQPTPITVSSSAPSSSFPLLNQLKKELNNATVSN